jgi:predicted phage baseplate assembly protein
VEDAQGEGAQVQATATAGSPDVAIAGTKGSPVPALQPPVQVLWDLFTVSRGRTVANERLGTGDATVPGQHFPLAQTPVTYLADTVSRSGERYSSTIVLSVDGIRWTEVPDFYGQPSDARVFVTREDDQGKTHVLIGDGLNGARLATGAVVSATYRVGSGANVPEAGALSTILTPVPNLASVRNPVPSGGGADPDPPDQIRRFAPRSVLTFGRAVSGDDYEVVAAQAPGVRRAAAVWSWDPTEQRAVVSVYVGDDDAAVDSARDALRAEADPNRPVVVLPALARSSQLLLSLRIAADRDPDPVVAAVRAALVDPDTGLFAPGILRIGEPLYRSRIEHVCSVPGVLAVHDLQFQVLTAWWWWWGSWLFLFDDQERYLPGEGSWFDLRPEDLTINVEATGV